MNWHQADGCGCCQMLLSILSVSLSFSIPIFNLFILIDQKMIGYRHRILPQCVEEIISEAQRAVLCLVRHDDDDDDDDDDNDVSLALTLSTPC